MPEVSVVIPTRNEESSIGICIEKVIKAFKANKIEGEIIVSDNSIDSTPNIATALGAKVVKPDRLGYGYAYRYGFRHASGKFIVMGDADNTYDFGCIPDLILPLKNGDADLVIGSRLKGKIMKGAMPPLHRYIGNPLLTWFLNRFFGAHVSDAHSGFRAFNRNSLEEMRLSSIGMEFASEMIIEAARNSLRIAEVPITYYPRIGSSKLGSFRDGWRHLKFMLLFAPKYLYFVPALIMILFGFLLMLASNDIIYIGYNAGIHSMILGSFSVIVGYELFILGLIAGCYGKRNNLFNVDHITKSILDHVTMDKGISAGLLLFSLSLCYLLLLLINWINSDYKDLPVKGIDILAFSLLVIGLQTLFSSFLLGIINGENGH